METKRFNSGVKWLAVFKNEIAVHCPNCNQKAKLIRETSNEYCCNENYKYECDHCFATITEEKKYIYTVKRNCPFCPEKIHYESQPTSKIKQSVEVSCSGCKSTLGYTPKVHEVKEWGFKGGKVEFDYWYEANFKGNHFWAINMEHLKYLEDFVTATLRERSNVWMGMRLVDKLPQFIKNAKNRSELLKLISKLKEK